MLTTWSSITGMGSVHSSTLFGGCPSSGSVAVGALSRSSHIDSPPQSSEAMSLASNCSQCPFCSAVLKTRSAFDKHVDRHKRIQKMQGKLFQCYYLILLF